MTQMSHIPGQPALHMKHRAYRS